MMAGGFGMAKFFGTDGIRGEANLYPMDVLTAVKVGKSLAFLLRKRTGGTPRILIGRDTRISGPMLEGAVAAGIASVGGQAVTLGVLPTPGVSFMTRDLGADAGVVISASHNPFQDNGIKIFSREGFKLSEEVEEELEALLQEGGLEKTHCHPREIGRPCPLGDAEGRYIVFLKSSFPSRSAMGGIRVILDTANGAAHRVAPAVFSELGADVEVIHATPDGININEGCGSQFTEGLQAKVIERKAALGLAFDGDGDRLIAVDEKGQRLTGDQILVICAGFLKEAGKLQNDLLVSTVMSNMGLTVACRRLGIRHHASKVGDRAVLEDMRRLGAVLGGEDSGHLIFLDHHTTGDGILAALQLVDIVIRSGKPLSELSAMMDLYPQKLVNVKVKRKTPVEELPKVRAVIRQAEVELADQGRVLVRFSGTENLCRIMVEGRTAEMTERICLQIAEVVRDALG
jgi:phosphoglucosamine mutase